MEICTLESLRSTDFILTAHQAWPEGCSTYVKPANVRKQCGPDAKAIDLPSRQLYHRIEGGREPKIC